VGGEVDAWGGNARLGQGDSLVAEADESDGSLVKFSPHIGIVTNIELDHPDHYNSLDEIVAIFKQFQDQSTVLIGCLDCPTLRKTLKPGISYALDASLEADYTVQNVAFKTNQTCATVYEHGKSLGTLALRLLGRHNLSNALAAVAVGRYLNLPFETIAASLASFGGAHRRFEHRGQVANITFLDDYAHHPSELKATLSAARAQASMGGLMNEPLDSSLTARRSDLLDEKEAVSCNGVGDRHDTSRSRIVAVFQPHRYSRTVTFLEDFAQAFDDADVVVLTDIYSAGEQNTTGISGQQVAEAIAQYHNRVIYKPTLPEVEVFLKDTLESGDLVLFLGAGNINKIIPDLLEFYRQKEDQMVQSSVYGS
jgi:UDP-N-acetylmuramate--alanine ligase